MPVSKKATRIGILFHDQASPTLGLLMRDVFLIANRLLQREAYAVELISATGGEIRIGPVGIHTSAPRSKYDILLVTPVSNYPKARPAGLDDECRLLQRLYAKNTRIAAPCLGVALLAQAGILDDREATTHWAWLPDAQTLFPEVRWNGANMVCSDGRVVTSGGYLGAVDLVLYLVSTEHGKKLSHELGRVLLAESVREKQSLYATRLLSIQDEGSPFHALEAWIDQNLHREITVTQLAEKSGMSLRSFQRKFTESHGMTVRAFLQLKRVEKAKELLRDTRLSLESVLERVGVSDVSSFRKLFQREIGLSPSEFRRRLS